MASAAGGIKNEQSLPACCCRAAAGLRAAIIKLFPKSVLMAGAAGIGVFIAFVGMKVWACAVAHHRPHVAQHVNTQNCTVVVVHNLRTAASMKMCFLNAATTAAGHA
jgi:xanthine/uracil/vitamin C permease (AzgA family)